MRPFTRETHVEALAPVPGREVEALAPAVLVKVRDHAAETRTDRAAATVAGVSGEQKRGEASQSAGAERVPGVPCALCVRAAGFAVAQAVRRLSVATGSAFQWLRRTRGLRGTPGAYTDFFFTPTAELSHQRGCGEIGAGLAAVPGPWRTVPAPL